MDFFTLTMIQIQSGYRDDWLDLGPIIMVTKISSQNKDKSKPSRCGD
jgi:hypothetical protein